MISVIFSTFNGELTLPKMLDSLLVMSEFNGVWEIIVVDNASNDNTRNIIESYIDRLPIKYVYEECKGKNFALNTALKFAVGDLYVFTDDDVIVDKNWLIELERAANTHKDFYVFGGKIEPEWPHLPSAWILENVQLGVVYALSKEEWPEGPVDPIHVMGPNMAVRSTVFKSGLKFETSIGPNGGNYAMGSETEFTCRLAGLGYRSFYVRSAIVKHIIRRHQLNIDWILGRAFRFGRGSYCRENKIADLSNIAMIFGIPRWMLIRVLKLWIANWAKLIFETREQRFKIAWELQYLKGYVYQAWITRG
jgi:glycosyltransferase involved in cell wall biosynthesis